MNFKLPKIYPLTDVSIAGFSHLEQVRKLVAGGATLIQLREKRAAPRDFYESAKAVIEFARAQNVKIIINDRVDIALAARADGVHLGQDDLPIAAARKILGGKAIIGFSTHTLAEAEAAARLPIDYIAVGPIFQTFSKENPDPILGLENLKKARQAVGGFPLVAIGGISVENAASVLQNGADSLAVIGAILNPPESVSEILKKLSRAIC